MEIMEWRPDCHVCEMLSTTGKRKDRTQKFFCHAKECSSRDFFNRLYESEKYQSVEKIPT